MRSIAGIVEKCPWKVMLSSEVMMMSSCWCPSAILLQLICCARLKSCLRLCHEHRKHVGFCLLCRGSALSFGTGGMDVLMMCRGTCSLLQNSWRYVVSVW